MFNSNAGTLSWLGLWFAFIFGWASNTWITKEGFSVPTVIGIFSILSFILGWYIGEVKPPETNKIR